MLKVTDRAASELKRSASESGAPDTTAIKLVPGENAQVTLAIAPPQPQDEIVYQEGDFKVAVDDQLRQPLTASVLDVENTSLPSGASAFRFVLRSA